MNTKFYIVCCKNVSNFKIILFDIITKLFNLFNNFIYSFCRIFFTFCASTNQFSWLKNNDCYFWCFLWNNNLISFFFIYYICASHYNLSNIQCAAQINSANNVCYFWFRRINRWRFIIRFFHNYLFLNENIIVSYMQKNT